LVINHTLRYPAPPLSHRLFKIELSRKLKHERP
jgi:hypothetical protein